MEVTNNMTTLQSTQSNMTDDDISKSVTSVEDHEIDRISMTIYLLLMLIPGTFLNVLVVFLTKKYHQFHSPYMYLKSACAVLDIMLAMGLIPHTIINDHIGAKMPSRIMCYSSVFGLGAFFSTAQFTAIVALEHYFYFCRPFLYQRWFTLKTVTVSTSVVFLLTQIYTFSTEIIYKRELQPLVALCQLDSQAYHSAIQFGIFFVPSIIATIFSIHKITRLINKVDTATGPSHAAQGNNSESMMRKRSAKRGLR